MVQLGSGKELIARKIHKNSNRKKGPFVILNGALLDVKKYELELFGEEKNNWVYFLWCTRKSVWRYFIN